MQFNSIQDLNNLIQSQLSDYITSDYVLYDIPNHRNIGDQLIYQGELDYLKTVPFKCVDKCSVSYNFKKQIKMGSHHYQIPKMKNWLVHNISL